MYLRARPGDRMDNTLVGNPCYRVISAITINVPSDLQSVEGVIRRLCQCDPFVQCDLLQTITYAKFKQIVLFAIKGSCQSHDQTPVRMESMATCLLSHQISLHWSHNTCEIRYLLPCVKRHTALDRDTDNDQHSPHVQNTHINPPKRRCVRSIQHT